MPTEQPADAGPAQQPDRIDELARSRFGWPGLRAVQRTAVERVLAGDDVLVVMPTGAGKSAVYQVSGLLLPGPTVVVSPLIALQADQVAALTAGGAARAVAVNSAQGARDSEQAWAAVARGEVEFLFLSPEQLARPEVVERVAALRPSLLVVDEAHCISAWGHDFRPDYLRLGAVVEPLGRPRLLALTATASPPVRAEIVQRLGMRSPAELVAGFDRPNIALAVQRYELDRDKRTAVVEQAAALPKPGLVYVATRRQAEEYAADLGGLGLAVAVYHAGRRAAERAEVHRVFSAGELDTVVATSAFGMGIDKADVRYVLHADVPASPDDYYQAVGRAGRDGEPAQAVLAYRTADLGLQRWFTAAAPEPEQLAAVAAAVRSAARTSTRDLDRQLDLTARRRGRLLGLLADAGVVALGGRGRVTYRDPGRSVEDAVAAAVALAEARVRVGRTRLDMMRGYAETTGCRRQFLLGYFGEQLEQGCGNCDTCLAASRAGTETGTGTGTETGTGATASPAGGGSQEPFPPNARVRHLEWGDGVVLSGEPDRVTVLFDAEGYRTLSVSAVLESALLERIG